MIWHASAAATVPDDLPHASGFALNDNFIHRMEYFGALLLSRTDGTRFVLSREDGIFVWALDRGGDHGAAVAAAQLVEPAFDGSDLLGSLFGAKLIVQRSRPVVSRDVVIAEAKALLRRSSARDYLAAPLNLSIYPVMRCQMHCKFCYVTEEKWRPGAAGADAWTRLISEAGDMGVPTVSVLGGDPTLYRGLPHLLRTFVDTGVTGVVTTNGLNVSDALLDAFVDAGDAVVLSVSLQSLDNLYHQSMTGLPVERTLAFIDRVSSAGRKFTINSVYIGQTDDQVRELLDYAVAIGASKLSFSVFVDVAQTGMRVPTFAEYRRLYELGTEHLQDSGADITFQVEGCQLYTAYPEFDGEPAPTEFERLVYGCEAGNGRLEIMHDGTALPCALFEVGRWSAGNVFEGGLREIWEQSKVLEKIRHYKNMDATCSGCTFGHFCNGGCPALNESRYGSITSHGDARCGIRNPSGAVEAPALIRIGRKPAS